MHQPPSHSGSTPLTISAINAPNAASAGCAAKPLQRVEEAAHGGAETIEVDQEGVVTLR